MNPLFNLLPEETQGLEAVMLPWQLSALLPTALPMFLSQILGKKKQKICCWIPTSMKCDQNQMCRAKYFKMNYKNKKNHFRSFFDLVTADANPLFVAFYPPPNGGGEHVFG
jgi:hypothetical protein